MFCKNCGAQLADDAQFCNQCGTAQQAAQPQQTQYYQEPQQTQYYQDPQQPQYYQDPQQTQYYQNPQQPTYQPVPQPSGLAAVKQYTPFIAVGMAAIALIFGIITLFNLFDVSATLSAGSYGTNTSSGPVADLIGEDGMGMLLVGNIIFGIILIAVAAIGGLFFAKNYGVKVYDSLTAIPFVTNESPLFVMGALGAIGAILQFICYLFAGTSESMFGITASISISVAWFTWVILVVFTAVAVFDMFFLNKKK